MTTDYIAEDVTQDTPAAATTSPAAAFDAASRQLTDMVVSKPVPAVLAAAATGAALMALIALMARPRSTRVSLPDLPTTKLPKSIDVPDADSLKDQLSDLISRIVSAIPSRDAAKQKLQDAKDAATDQYGAAKDTATQRYADAKDTASQRYADAKDAAAQKLSDAGDTAQAAWNSVKGQASDVLDQIQPQLTAATKMARDNPVWAAVLAGALGTLIGAQFIGKSGDSKN